MALIFNSPFGHYIINKMLKKVYGYIPKEDRPDFSDLATYFKEETADPKFLDYKDYRLMPGFSPEMMNLVLNQWEPKENDVIVASYPKTGTTWVRHIIRHIIYKDDPKVLEFSKEMHMFHIYLETGTPVKFEMWEKLPWKQRLLTTHLPANLLNMEKMKKAKIIYTIRNPRDQLVSWYNMSKNLPYHKNPKYIVDHPLDFDKFVQKYINGEQRICQRPGEWYPDHLLTWYPHRNDENVLFVVFEDLKMNPVKEIRKIAKFLNVEMSDAEIEHVVQKTAFKQMKKDASFGDKSIKFYRKGDVGDWKNYLTEKQVIEIDQKMNEKLKDTDIKFTYEL